MKSVQTIARRVFFGPPPAVCDTSLPRLNMDRRLDATFPGMRVLAAGLRCSPFLLLAVRCSLFLVLLPLVAAAPLPDAGNSVRAFSVARAWLNAPSFPTFDDPAAQVIIPNATGICVTLRSAGRVVASAIDLKPDGLMLRRAVGRAFGEVLSDPAVTNLPADVRNSLGPTLLLELEIAGGRTPLLGRTFAAAANSLEAGFDGLLMIHANRSAAMFPMQLRQRNTTENILGAVNSLAVELQLPPRELSELAATHSISSYSFRTRHFAQQTPADPPFPTYRGDIIVLESQLTPDYLATLTNNLARHIMSRAWQGDQPLGLTGTYHPVSDSYQPLIAPPLEQALAAFALARFAHAEHQGLDEELRKTALTLASKVLSHLTHIESTEADPLKNLAACAMILYATTEFVAGHPQPDPLILELQTAAASQVLSWTSAFINNHDAEPLDPPVQAMLAGCLARLRLHQHDIDARLIRQLIDRTWEPTPPPQRPALLPWILWAEIDLAASEGGPIVNTEEHLALRELLLASQVLPPTAMERDPKRIDHVRSFELPTSLDLVGGYVLSTSPKPTATSQSLRPILALGSMLKHPQLTPDTERERFLASHRRALRFLAQLTIRPDCAWSTRNPTRAIGGVRDSLTNNQQPLPAQALALLALLDGMVN